MHSLLRAFALTLSAAVVPLACATGTPQPVEPVDGGTSAAATPAPAVQAGGSLPSSSGVATTSTTNDAAAMRGAAMPGASSQVRGDFAERADVREFIDQMVSKHGFERASLTATVSAAQRKQGILDAISRPAEKRLEWKDYRKIFLGETRIRQGVEFWKTNQTAIDNAAQAFRVEPEIIVAIIGVETQYGRVAGSYRVLDALTTLGFDYPPRSSFFRGELEQFLLLSREQRVAPETLVGSYAGAMGYGQFIPSSYRRYAVDFDGDGTTDIWKNPVDAVGSVANYFAEHGWLQHQSVVHRVDGGNKLLEPFVGTGPDLKWTRAQLTDAGLIDPQLDPGTKLSVLRMEGDSGPEYWLGEKNFYVITRYNRSPMYAMAVYQLAQEIRRLRTASETVASRAGPVTNDAVSAPADAAQAAQAAQVGAPRQ